MLQYLGKRQNTFDKCRNAILVNQVDIDKTGADIAGQFQILPQLHSPDRSDRIGIERSMYRKHDVVLLGRLFDKFTLVLTYILRVPPRSPRASVRKEFKGAKRIRDSIGKRFEQCARGKRCLIADANIITIHSILHPP